MSTLLVAAAAVSDACAAAATVVAAALTACGVGGGPPPRFGDSSSKDGKPGRNVRELRRVGALHAPLRHAASKSRTSFSDTGRVWQASVNPASSSHGSSE